MSPSIVDSLKKKQPYFVIIDKNQEHLKKAYYDIVCFELTKNDPFYKQIRYKSKPFFLGILQLEKFTGHFHMEPFKLWKIRKDPTSGEWESKNVDPDLARNMILYSEFIVIGDLKNQPSGYNLDKFQLVETDPNQAQEMEQKRYQESLEPVIDYIQSIQFDMSKIRQFIFCHSCKMRKKYTLLDSDSRYKNHAFYVCQSCAGKEVLKILKDRKIEVSKTLKQYLRDVLRKFRNVNDVLNVFNPNYNFIDHPEATLVNVKKKSIPKKKVSPTTIYEFEIPPILQLYFNSKKRDILLPVQTM